MLVDEYQRQGMDLVASLEATKEWASVNIQKSPEERASQGEEALNDRALAQLEHLLMGGSLG
jgi:hypothetical protein